VSLLANVIALRRLPVPLSLVLVTTYGCRSKAPMCTFNNNSALTGGAAAITSGSGTFTIQDSTISGNTASATAGGAGGGGIARTTATSNTITIANSVISGNTNANGPDILAVAGTTTNVNFSAIGSNTGFTLSGTSGNNIPFGTSLQLGSLTNNGGPTQTMLPASGSPLIDAGSNALVPSGVTTDQRGGQFPRILGAAVDIGAVERTPPAPAVIASQFVFTAAPNVLDFTFTQDVSASLSAGDLEVDQVGDGTVTPITYTGYTAGTNTATFTLPNLPDGNYRARFLPGSVVGPFNTPLPPDFSFDFFALGADANHDRTVNALDFNAVATNFGIPNRNFGQGDFNYDGIVNTSDFTALAMQFGKTLAPPSQSPMVSAVQASPALDLFSSKPILGQRDPSLWDVA
jgi:hypothetical protein